MDKNSSDQPDTATFRNLAFATRKAAGQAYEDISNLGVSPDDVSLFVHAWATRCRRLVKDYERYAATLAGFHVIAFVRYMLRHAEDLMKSA